MSLTGLTAAAVPPLPFRAKEFSFRISRSCPPSGSGENVWESLHGAQTASLPYRGFPIREPASAAASPSLPPAGRMEFGDTADWNSALHPGLVSALNPTAPPL